MEINVVIIDDHFLVRNALKTILFDFGVKNISEGQSCAEMLSILRRTPATHLFLDLLVSDGNTIEVIPAVRRIYPHIQIMVSSVQSFDTYKLILRQFGITRFLQKDADEKTARNSINDFLYRSDYLAEVVTPDTDRATTPFTKLSLRELQVLHYLLRGEGTKYIATNLNIEMNTVSTVKARIFQKTGAMNIKELLELAGLYKVT